MRHIKPRAYNNPAMKKQATIVFDLLGISSATLCLVHCLVFPLLTVLPLGFTGNHYLDLFFAFISFCVVLKIIFSSSPLLVKVLLCCSIITVIVGVILESFLAVNSPLVLIGGLGMIIGHLINYKSH
ncbi:fucose 4-O-acetylase-like acetyltransferase [Flavobacterium sp. 7E]|uniref:MerC domain-containing protein n=1 Tax=Flavobacterium sp. 7E TaxID=2735898 RepID=UPI0020C5E6E8|nr:MerC domain-containing protein [Flavobacterium sp. 7E]NRS88393.1 fucose 4-O-acetylase-like acetyltransferase [Flavobacterium sp. 7E]